MQMVLMRLSKPQPLLGVFASVGSGALGLMLATAVAAMPHEPLGIDQDMDVHLREQDMRDRDPMNYVQQCLFGVMLLLNILMSCCQGPIRHSTLHILHRGAAGRVPQTDLHTEEGRGTHTQQSSLRTGPRAHRKRPQGTEESPHSIDTENGSDYCAWFGGEERRGDMHKPGPRRIVA